MTDQHRNALRVAQAFASVLIESIDHEIKGGDPSWREEAATQLAQALRDLPPSRETLACLGFSIPEGATVTGLTTYAMIDGKQVELDTVVYNPLFATKPSTEPYPQHIDADRTLGPSDWDRECQESRRLNR